MEWSWWPAGREWLWLAAGTCGLAFLAYCLYFDQKRRGAPNFKRRLRESEHPGLRLLTPQAGHEERRKEREKAKERESELSELKDTANLQDFFLQEIQVGEIWLAKGEPKKSIEHLINAISVCTYPHQLMQVLEQTLPPHVFEMLVCRIPYTMQQLETSLNEQD
nr:TOMM20-like protein 1 [Pogona vitticeps]